MREIKFRAYSFLQKVMAYDVELYIGTIPNDPGGSSWLACDGEWGKRIRSDERIRGKNVPILMQYTGLKDKNGVEIYEGDKVRAFGGEQHHSYYENDIRGVVEFTGGCFLLKKDDVFYDMGNIEYLEVIGNIYTSK